MENLKLVNLVIELIKENHKVLNQILQEDKTVNSFEFDVQRLIDLIKKFKNQKAITKTKQKILVEHYGNPYITALLCMESLINQTDLIIGIEDCCYGLNQAIVKIVNEVGQGEKILLENNLTCEEIEKINPNKMVCLGNSNAYMRFRKMKNRKVQNIPLFNLTLYYDSEIYEELAQTIRNYAIQNFYEIEVFDETEEFEEVMEEMKGSQNQYCAVILSKDKEKQKRFRQEMEANLVCVNENPFAKFEWEIPKEVF